MLDIFDYSGPVKLFERLQRQYEKLEEAPTDPDLALDFCQTAWSLADWVFYDRYPLGTNSEKGNFRTTVLFPACDELKIMHDIANGIKHFQLSSPKADIESVETHEGTFDNTFDSTFEISYIKIKFEGGDWSDLNEIMDKVFEFWKAFLGC